MRESKVTSSFTNNTMSYDSSIIIEILSSFTQWNEIDIQNGKYISDLCHLYRQILANRKSLGEVLYDHVAKKSKLGTITSNDLHNSVKSMIECLYRVLCGNMAPIEMRYISILLTLQLSEDGVLSQCFQHNFGGNFDLYDLDKMEIFGCLLLQLRCPLILHR